MATISLTIITWLSLKLKTGAVSAKQTTELINELIIKTKVQLACQRSQAGESGR